MGRIDVILDDKLEQRLREEVFKRYGMKRGNLTEAIKDAIVLWLTENPKKPVKNPD
jgi:hypothetical protein